MANSIIMPKTGMAMETGVIIRWLKKEGDAVKKGEPVAEIETDKTAMELESDYEGVILKILRLEGETVPVTETIAWIGKQGEAVPAAPLPESARTDKPQETPAVQTSGVNHGFSDGAGVRGKIPATPAARRRALELGIGLSSISSLPERGYLKAADVTAAGAFGNSSVKVSATPLARRIAETRAIPLEKVAGSGPGGKIIKTDVLYLNGMGTEAGTGPQTTAADSVIPLTSIQKITAKRMFQSHSEIPVVTIAMNADVTKLIDLRSQLNEELDGIKISINDFAVKAAALALRQHPRLNAEFAGDHLLARGNININIAVDTDQGLMVPVIRNADLLPLASISVQSRSLAEKARSRKLSPEDMQGGTFTISNVGMQGVTFFTPIINQPQTAILGVCAIEERLVKVQGDIQERKIMGLCLTFDHRALDGAEAARFLQTLKIYLEKPMKLLTGR